MIDIITLITTDHTKYISIFAYIIFIVLLIAIYFNRKEILKLFGGLDRKTWLIIILILLSSFLIRFFFIQHFHRWYIDEPWALERAKMFITHEEFSQYFFRHPIGWSFLLSIIFSVFGVSSGVALFTSSFFGTITVLSVFFLAFKLLKNKSIALWSAFIFSLIPTTMLYSGTAVNNVSSSFFLIITLISMIYYYETKSFKSLALTISLIGFTALFRAENYLLIILFFLGLKIFNCDYKKMVNTRFLLAFLIICILIIPNLMQILNFYIVSDNAAQNTQDEVKSNWNLTHILRNKETFIGLVYNNIHPFIFSILYLVGIVIGFRLFKKESKFLISLIIPFLIIFSLHFDSPTRFLISIYPLLAVFAGIGTYYLITLIGKRLGLIKTVIIVFVIIVISFVPHIINVQKSFSPDHYLETNIPDLLRYDLKDNNCILITEMPTVLKAVMSKEVISTKNFIEKNVFFKNDECFLFFEDTYCDIYWRETNYCKKMKNSYQLESFITYNIEDIRPESSGYPKKYYIHKVIAKTTNLS